MARRRDQRVDVAYVGFLLGHGGDALQMLSLAKGIRDRGARVRLVVPAVEHSEGFSERCAALSLECERTDLMRMDMNLTGAQQSPLSMIRLLRGLDASVVHFHSGDSCLPRTAMLALEMVRPSAPLVTLQSPFETITPGGLRARLWAATARRRLRAVVSPSEHGTRFQRSCGVPASVALTIRNGVDTGAFQQGDGARPRAQLGLDPESPLVLFGSRLDRQKKPLHAVEIFAGVAREFPDALLVYIGTGEEEEAVRQRAEGLGLAERVRLMGYVTRVPDWLAASTVWLLPTERENFSVAVLEAMAAGCPVLSTCCTGNDEILVHEENALTFVVGDLDTATAQLRRMLADASLRERLGEGARQAVQEYSMERVVDRYEELYAACRRPVP
jgi:glycosyltransferase involved in cell wall biosynthesis